MYSTCYELVPAAPITLKLKVQAGDAMVASVTVKDRDVTLRIRNLSTGKMFTRTRRVSRIDSSSAEWIAEAPSVCVTTNICRTPPLTDFGSVAFSDLSATAGGQTGPVEDPLWSATELELREAQNFPQGPRPSAASISAVAIPSALSSGRLGVCGDLGRAGDPERTADPADAAGFQRRSTLSNVPAVRSYTYLTVSLRDPWLVRGCLVSPCLVSVRDTVPSLLGNL